jgi:hypothetical protein
MEEEAGVNQTKYQQPDRAGYESATVSPLALDYVVGAVAKQKGKQQVELGLG